MADQTKAADTAEKDVTDPAKAEAPKERLGAPIMRNGKLIRGGAAAVDETEAKLSAEAASGKVTKATQKKAAS